MADSDKSGPGRKLPPISPRPKNNDEDGAVKTVKKKKKKPAADVDAESGTEDAKTTPRRRRRTPSASRDTDEEKKVNDTTEATTTTKKKKKKTKPKETAETEEQPVSDRSVPSAADDVTGSKASLITKDSKDGTPRKKVKKKKVVKKKAKTDDEYADSGLAADLTSIEDDIIKDDDQKEDIELPQTTNVGVLRSQPTQKIYVETTRGFKKENRAKMEKRLAAVEAERQVVQEDHSKTTIELALMTYRIFKTFCLFIHGLTAGLALWQVIVVYVLSSFSNEDFLAHYASLALPVQCCAYLLLSLCLVSACDRFDIGSINRQFVLRALSLRNGAVSILFYLTAAVLSVTIVSTEDKMHLYDSNQDLWADPQATSSELTTWRSFNTARGVFAMLGWVVLSITPNADRLSKNLREGDDVDLLGNEADGVIGASAA